MVRVRVRSPNYPALSLPDALHRAKAVHKAEQHLAAPRAVIAKHLGYNSLNGASMSAISALIKYGLLEEANGDKLKLSAAAISLLFPANASEKAAAIKDAAFKPALFAEISNEWGGHQPSEENLRSYLMRRNFAADAVERVIKSYRETMELVTEQSGAYPSAGSKGPEEKPMHGVEITVPHHASAPSTAAEPFRVSFSPGGIDVTGRITDMESADELIRTINALKLLLKPSSEIKKPPEEP